jgi:predicted dithiol-disulfide oxidoreductase (DUF899 family)
MGDDGGDRFAEEIDPAMKTSRSTAANGHPVVSPEEWLEARRTLLAKEKALTRQRDSVCEERRALPWVRVEKDYRFQGPEGEVTLAELFRGRRQLIVYHFMFGPGWKEGCDGCSFISDHVDSARQHFEHRDVAFAAVSRAPWQEFAPFRKRMGWKFPWVSSAGSDFNFDLNVSYRAEQIANKEKVMHNFQETEAWGDETHGISVFWKDDDGTIYHTYSCYARGAEETLGTFMWMDLTPLGRNEQGTMNWVRHHDRYEDSPAPCCGCRD